MSTVTVWIHWFSRERHKRETNAGGEWPAFVSQDGTAPCEHAWKAAKVLEARGMHVLHPTIHRPHMITVFDPVGKLPDRVEVEA
jgi:hypothetical protein